ncbi:MAG: tryptophan synthase subunit alpha [Anaerosomatales bacterium]|nr:tryptophan synthase subunit alpha [Anaerosomatales bacterium]MDT8434466.1 tryptophan synthase subunit alpha [Anaerosomatales bacterium]
MPSDPGRTEATGLGRGFPADRAALVVYLMAGYPDRATSLESLRAAARSGADVIELGVPYGNPLADGPVIAEAAAVAREAGFGLAESIDLAAEFIAGAGAGAPPVALMTYLNPLMRMGPPRAAAAMREAGIAGVIVPDMPPEAARPWLAAASGIDTVFLVAPTSTPGRLATVGAAASGFVYCVSTTGVTGERSELPAELDALVRKVRARTTLPVAVGFGISEPAQASAVARIADGVVVGSAVVRRQEDPDAVGEFVGWLAAAVRSART